MPDSEEFDFRAFNAGFEIAAIVACARNGVIGNDGDLPWRLPDDLRHFMRSTKGCPVIMGRKTYETLPGPLPDRFNIVVSRTMLDPKRPGLIVVRDLDEAIEQGRVAISQEGMDRPIWIAGGGMIYEQALSATGLVVRTLIDTDAQGDAWFPELDLDEWELRCSISHPADARHGVPFVFEWWIRRGEAG